MGPDRPSRGIRWGGYLVGERLALIQSKTGNEIAIPRAAEIDRERVRLYPELEAEVATIDRRADADFIVRDERTGEPYTVSYMQTLHQRVRAKARLSTQLTFTSFRHGDITELGNAGEVDVRAVSEHTTLDTTRIYNKANAEKAVRIVSRHRAHIALVTARERRTEG